MKYAVLHMERINCPNCERHIREAANGVAGVKSVEPDCDTDIAPVKYDESVTSIGEITDAVEKSGYHVMYVSKDYSVDE